MQENLDSYHLSHVRRYNLQLNTEHNSLCFYSLELYLIKLLLKNKKFETVNREMQKEKEQEREM